MDINKCSNWDDFRAQAKPLGKKAKGDAFEALTKYYLQLEPKYATDLKNAWLLREVPAVVRKKLNLPGTDEGIDLIAEAKNGEYWAIQCKYKENESVSVTRRELATFTDLAFGICKGISYALVCTNADRHSHKLKKYGDRIGFCSGEDFRKLDKEFFDRLRKLLDKKSARPKPLKPRKHQQRAIREAQKHFNAQKSRGKLIHPCGSGKSLTGYWIAEKLEAKKILVAVPSLALVKQTLDVWAREAWANKKDINWIAVCSDESVGDLQKDDVAVLTQDLGVHVHTDPKEITSWLKSRSKGLKVVFTTYQSGKATAQAARNAGVTFDLGIMDEAHKTVGDKKSLFSHLLYDTNISINKRAFMTATERHYRGARDDVVSMDDINLYGETFEFMSFKEALETDPPILSDYKIVTMFISQDEIKEMVKKNVLVRPDKGKWDKEVEANMLASLIAHRKASQKHRIRHTVSFHSSIARAKAFADTQERANIAFKTFEPLEAFHVKGGMPTSVRASKIDEFTASRYGLITNAKCLTEGVDVPDIDCVLFADPRKSTVDIVQAVGRALRTSKGKNYGYVIVPVVIDKKTMDTRKLDKGAFDDILMVLRALSANDDRIVEYFRTISHGKMVRELDVPIDMDIPVGTLINADEFLESVQEIIWSRLARLSWRPFEEAREFVRSLNLSSSSDWIKYGNNGKLPSDIPITCERIYKDKGWVSWGDWLGTGRIAYKLIKYRHFQEACEYARSLTLKGNAEWRRFCNGDMPEKGALPNDIPVKPDHVYKGKGWNGWGDWLGTGRIANQKRGYRPFIEAREYARSLGLKNRDEWKRFYKGELTAETLLPNDVPKLPDRAYKGKGWDGWLDWLGVNKMEYISRRKEYRPFIEAREYARSLGLKGNDEWKRFCKGEMPEKGIKPDDIPVAVWTIYKGKGWNGWGDWLGTGRIANQKRGYRPFIEAREYARSLGLKTNVDWRRFCKGETYNIASRPHDIPHHPERIYKDKGWISWYDWLGTDKKKKK